MEAAMCKLEFSPPALTTGFGPMTFRHAPF